MLKLVLHATEEELREGVRADDTTSGDELIDHEVVLVFGLDQSLDLVIDSDDDGDEPTGEEDGADEDVPREHQHEGVVNEDGDAFLPVGLGDGELDGLHLPGHVETRVSEHVEEVLVGSPPLVLAGRGLPEMEDGLVVDIAVDAEAVGEDVMSVVLVGPPAVGETVGNTSDDLAEDHGDSVAAVAPVVAEPAGLLHTKTQHEGSDDGVRGGEEPAKDQEAEGGDDVADHFIEPRAVEETVSDELATEVFELTRDLVTGDFGVGDGLLGHALELLDGVFGVESVEGVGGVLAVEPVQQLGAAGVLVAPGSEVVALIVDADDALGELRVVLVRELELERNGTFLEGTC